MIAPQDRRRGWILALSGCAAALAAVLAIGPMAFGGERPAQQPQSFLNQVEGGGFDHNSAHQTASPTAKARALARMKLCADPAWSASHAAFCPEQGATNAQIRTARLATMGLSAQSTAEPGGEWGPLLSIPTTAIHAVVMPTNKVLYFSQPKYPAEDEATDGGNAHVWDPLTNTTKSVPPPKVSYDGRTIPFADNRQVPANLWCAGQTLLPDGRVLVVGGNLEYPINNGNGVGHGFKGGKWVMTFDPWTETWTRYQDMDHGRWYPTLTELPDGRVLIVGGWDETGGSAGIVATGPPTMHNDLDVEVFDPNAAAGSKATTVVSQLPPNSPGQTDQWPNHEGIGLYPHMFVLPSTTALGAGGNKVLVAGPTKYDSAVIDTDTWLWTDVVEKKDGNGNNVPDTGQPRISSDRSWGTAWLEPSGPDGSTKVVLLGGSDAANATPGIPGSSPPPIATAEVLDLNDPDRGWVLDPALTLNEGRAHFNTTLLPGGSIFTNGGGYGRQYDTLYAAPIYTSELLAPGGVGGWRNVGDEADARTYHSTAVLLPDGRVISAGDDRDIAPAAATPTKVAGHIAVSDRTAQIWTPPYLFAGDRPVVTFTPDAVGYDAPFRVAVQGAPSAITTAYLMRPSAVTHAVNMSQEAIALDVTAGADGLTMTSPLDASVAPPGYYMLFLLNGDGVPSTASWVKIDPAAPAAPGLPAPPAAPPSAPPPAPVGGVPGDAPAPAPAPAGTPVIAPTPSPTPAPRRAALTLRAPKPRVKSAGARIRVTQTFRVSVASTVRLTVTRSRGRVVARRTVRAKRGVTYRRRLLVRRSLLSKSRTLRVRVVASTRSRGKRTRTHVARVPARR